MIKLEDIAKLAGVSTATASLALNNKPGVNNQTKNHVMEVAKAHNYAPIRVHRKKKYNRTIRLVVCTDSQQIREQYTTYPLIDDIFLALQQLYDEKEDRLIKSIISSDNVVDNISKLESIVQSNFILVMATALTHEQIIDLKNNFANIIFVDNMKHKIHANFVSVNNYLGGYTAALELVKHNHKNIGYIKGNYSIQNFDDRYQGFIEGLAEHNLTISEDYVLNADNLLINSAINNFKVTNIKNIPTAFFCENDYIAVSAINFFSKQGLQVPRNISVIGFDGLSDNHKLDYDITSVKYNADEIALACYMATNNANTIRQIMINPEITTHSTLNKR